MSYTETVAEQGDYRVRLILDEYPTEPEFEAGFPVLRIDWNGWGNVTVEHTGYGDDVLDGADTLGVFLTRFGNRQGIDVFERWLRIFHDGAIVENHTASRDYVYLAYSCRELWEKWGTDYQYRAEGPDMDEWIAYVEGDVWGYVVERKVDLSMSDYDELTEWVEVEDGALWGFYGHEHAEAEAIAALRYEVRDTEVAW